MQFLNALVLAGAASASSIQARQYPQLYITQFSAACVAHSVRCSYSFEVTGTPGGVFAPTKCSVTLNGPDYLPAVSQAPCEHSYRFDFSKAADGGLDMTVWLRANSRVDQNYCHHIAPSDLVVDNNLSVQTQRYVGATEFIAAPDQCAR